MRIAVIMFPGSNCERDAQTASAQMLAGGWANTPIEGDVVPVWHNDTTLPSVDVVILPGGFSYGDALRSGAIAARSPIMNEVRAHANRGGYVLGICNGFQILTESGMLPGALMRNRDLRFICKRTHLRVEHARSLFISHYKAGEVIALPVAHHDGNYRCTESELQQLEDAQQILFRYADADGTVHDASNINGSIEGIAGIMNAKGNILGMMPHPERACDPKLQGTDGRGVFASMAETVLA